MQPVVPVSKTFQVFTIFSGAEESKQTLFPLAYIELTKGCQEEDLSALEETIATDTMICASTLPKEGGPS
jgi:hypothetical protein